MNSLDWTFMESFYHDEFGRPMRGLRWKNKFSHLDKEVFLQALYLHGEESNTAPTVKQVIDCLPTGLVRRGKPDHLHAWDELPLEQGRAGMLVWCNTCGEHRANVCGCLRCVCEHVRARRITRLWYACVDCEGTIRAREDDPDVPF